MERRLISAVRWDGLSFELSNTHSQVIGIDTSLSFIEKARELLQHKKLSFDLIVEGHITRKRSYEFSDKWVTDRVEFIVADALALPFPNCLFPTVSSINILEKVPHPIQHLTEINRVLTVENARFVFSDPFSWTKPSRTRIFGSVESTVANITAGVLIVCAI